MTFDFFTHSTPLGDFSVACDPTGAVVGTAFGGRDALLGRLPPASLRALPCEASDIRRQVVAYFKGDLREFTVRLAPDGTPFQHRVWSALRNVPYGERRSYGALAASLGSSARAVGRANATNPICLFIPCHRIVGADGSLTGYAFGEDIKRRLLELEALHLPRSSV